MLNLVLAYPEKGKIFFWKEEYEFMSTEVKDTQKNVEDQVSTASENKIDWEEKIKPGQVVTMEEAEALLKSEKSDQEELE